MRFHFSNPFNPPPAPPAFGSGQILPEKSAPILSRLIFHWLSPFLEVGFSRPLESADLWELPQSQLTSTLTDKTEKNFYSRCPPEMRPRFMVNETQMHEINVSPTISQISSVSPNKHTARDVQNEKKEYEPDTEKAQAPELPKDDSPHNSRKDKKPKYDQSLFKALFKTFFFQIWTAGILKLTADTLNTTSPLVNKVLLQWLTDSFVYFRLTGAEQAAAAAQGVSKPQGVGYGIGLAFALFIMQEAASLMTNHYTQRSLIMGLTIRTAIIGAVFRKTLRLSGRGRVDNSVGKITTMISADAARLDRFSGFAHNLWVAPIQLAIGIGLLIGNLGFSALVGLGVLIFGFPVQFVLVKIMFTQRKKCLKFTDKRVRITTEVLQGIRLIKSYAWEAFYVQQVGLLRTKEIETIRLSAMARSILIALMTFIPILASVLSFITYALSGHDLNVAVIFSSLQLFNIIRIPITFLPLVLSSLSDALVALGRISKLLTSDDLPESYPIDKNLHVAVQVEGDFVWETVLAAGEVGKGTFVPGDKDKKPLKAEKSLPMTTADVEKETPKDDAGKKLEETPFELKNLKISVPKGAFVGIVGRVGSGKSSVLQALIGEMRRKRGNVALGGTVSYAPQTPWIRNATLRQNVLFGEPDNEDRFREVIRACSLEHDLEVLPNGEETEIGERGINLSGGQKARVSLARAAYSNADIVLLDDPLSAVDAYVGKSILDNCLLAGPLADRTRILVTHALHVLDRTDYIYVMDDGIIIEQGTYEDLMANSVVFAHLMEEHGNLESELEQDDQPLGGKLKRKDNKDAKLDEAGPKKADTALMQIEERNTGAVTWSTYRKYLRFAGTIAWAPVLILLLTLSQTAQVGNNLFLGFWTSRSIPGLTQGGYIAFYASLGVAQAIFSFLFGFSFAVMTLVASLNLFRSAFDAVLRSPTSFFDTTPLGRILSRLSKDQDTLDNELSMNFMQFLLTFSSVLGTVALVFYTFPLLGIIFVPMTIVYYLIAKYYRRSSVETKRIDSLMRSILYASFSETLTGLATIRAYRQQDRAVKDAEAGLDLENRAYYMTISIQRWLTLRLDLLGNTLVLGIALFAAGYRHTVNPSKIGVVLSYTLSITQIFSQMVSQFAQNEQNMNAVERVLHYSELPPESDFTTPNDPPPTWPTQGKITFSNVEMAYRKGLPLVLKDVSFEINPGEKVGVVGRTGAGKSSLLQAMFRIVELSNGKIEIDGYNVQSVGLNTLRRGLALVPQDSTLFLGTLRDNIDPQGLRTDAELISSLQRSWLLPKDGPPDPASEAKFSLDSIVGDEGANFSAGEKQLLALCRALVKNSRIIVLDEATSQVDVETDAKIQRTVQMEFASSTLLCIAHRLNTIAYYDRVIVMDGGKIAEFDTVLNLFDNADSIFRSLCDEANLQRADIVRIRAEHDVRT